jgi:hypothetical protein
MEPTIWRYCNYPDRIDVWSVAIHQEVFPQAETRCFSSCRTAAVLIESLLACTSPGTLRWRRKQKETFDASAYGVLGPMASDVGPSPRMARVVGGSSRRRASWLAGAETAVMIWDHRGTPIMLHQALLRVVIFDQLVSIGACSACRRVGGRRSLLFHSCPSVQ